VQHYRETASARTAGGYGEVMASQVQPAGGNPAGVWRRPKGWFQPTKI